MSDPLYAEMIMDEGKHPKNKGSIEHPDISLHDSNPLCGDDITLQLKIDGISISEVKWKETKNELRKADCCTLCKACTSVLTQLIDGKDLDCVKNLDEGTILSELGLDYLSTTSPVRIKCALLSLKILKKGLYSYLVEKLNADDDEAKKLKEEAEHLY